MNDPMSKIPPQSLEAEQAALGSMLIENRAALTGLEIVTANDFYRPAHQDIYEAIRELVYKGQPLDIITVQNELKKHGKLDDIGGTEYLMSLVETVPTAANVEHYANIVLRKSQQRKLIDAGMKIIGIGNDNEHSAPEEEAIQIIQEACQMRDSGLVDVKDVVSSTYERWRAYERGEYETGVKWIPHSLNRIVRPLRKGKLTVIGADTSHGKSVMLKDCIEAVCDSGGAVLMFSYEMTSDEILDRIICSKSKIDIYDVEAGLIDWDSASPVFNDCHGYRLKLVERQKSIEGLMATARRWNMQENRDGKGCIVVDYAQLVFGDKYIRDPNVLVSQVMKSLKSLALELSVPIVTASQLRKGAQNTNVWEYAEDLDKVRFPKLDDLFGASEIRNSADTALMLVNPPDQWVDADGKRKAYIKNAKERGGRAGGKLELWYYPKYTRFENYTAVEPNYA